MRVQKDSLSIVQDKVVDPRLRSSRRLCGDRQSRPRLWGLGFQAGKRYAGENAAPPPSTIQRRCILAEALPGTRCRGTLLRPQGLPAAASGDAPWRRHGMPEFVECASSSSAEGYVPAHQRRPQPPTATKGRQLVFPSQQQHLLASSPSRSLCTT
ncbi:uncharacterized protein LOC112342544 [Selaginella moellendorffii]|uniref:uncharacterized protein LOC112342544 n=1 Tax=Selaginella moellendorffii TaxID=88036 RepID=UPI000D1D03F9|nr:uncharacterized protein LOC112342544 [Selaginella moellendorffii]|eukprot:XP_024520312.1 uncharacterized protein LOC112342544 [Selaginella moellendorffii]